VLGSDPLSLYQDVIDAALRDARQMLQGAQGPIDSPCCTAIEPAASVTTFGTPGDGLDVIDFAEDGDAPTLRAIANGMPAVFLVDSLSTCGGVPAPGAIGCADTPLCPNPPADVAVVTLGGLERGLLGATIAHERGHNTCLQHDARTGCDPSGSCPCLADAISTAEDGLTCSDGPVQGICSGGVCGESSGSASATLVGAVDTNAGGVFFDDLVRGSGLTANWAIAASIGSGAIPNGLAYGADRGVLYGVQVAGPDGELLEIDPETGAVTQTTTLTGLPGLISLAYDPGGPGTGDDRLLAVDRQPEGMGSQIEQLIAIDPDDGSVSSLCQLASNSQVTAFGFFSGLAFDVSNDQLFGAGGGGLFSISPICGLTQIPHPGTSTAVTLAGSPVALAYSDAAGAVHMISNQPGPRTLHNVIVGGVTVEVSTTFGIDDMSPGGLAAVPVLGVAGVPALPAIARLIALGAMFVVGWGMLTQRARAAGAG